MTNGNGVDLSGPLAGMWRDVYRKAAGVAEARAQELLKYHVYTYPHGAGDGGGGGGGTGGGWVLLDEIGPLAVNTAYPLGFDNIAQDATHLWLHFEGRGTGTGSSTLAVQLNGDNGATNYSWTMHHVAPSATHTLNFSNGDNTVRVAQTLANASEPAGSLTTADVHIPDYAKSDARFQRIVGTAQTDNVDTSGYNNPELDSAVGAWHSGAPVTAVRFWASVGHQFAIGTHIQLYGLSASGGGGGDGADVTITTDASLTATESPANTFALAARLSADAGNALSLHADGLYSTDTGTGGGAEVTITTDASLTATESPANTFALATRLSPDAGNALALRANGLYATDTGGGGGTGNTTMYTQTSAPTGATNSLWFNPSESA